MERTEGAGEVAGMDPRSGTEQFISQKAYAYYKGLVGQIEIALPERTSRTLMLTGSWREEGTTVVTLGLGLTLAAAMGHKTAIIDANTMHPDMHRRFGTQNVGLGEYLSAGIPLEQALVNTTVPNLYVMPAGRGMATLAGFSKDRLAAFIENVKKDFEYVLVDSPPLGPSPESTVLCEKVDAVILVVRHGATRREVVGKTKEVIERAGGKLLGIVLNRRKFPVPEFLYRRL
jgi:capsular exopolysaccharide synthesis family protein